MSQIVEVRVAFPAMGTRFALAVRTRPERAGQARWALEAAARWVRRVELRLSRFDPQSDLSRLNAGASGCWQVVSPLMFSALQAAEQARRLTGGLFDPAVLDALTRWGYDRDWRTLQTMRGRPALRAPSPAAAAAHGARQEPSRPQPAGAGGAPFQLDPLVRAVRLQGHTGGQAARPLSTPGQPARSGAVPAGTPAPPSGRTGFPPLPG